jgi:FkbH-like protein
VIADLGWLPPPPLDFRQHCRALLEESGADVPALVRLATCALDENHLNRLARVVEAMRARGGALAGLTPFKLGIVSNATIDTIVPAVIATGVRLGLDITCVSAPFGLGVQAALEPDSTINAARPDAVLLAFDHHSIGAPPAGDAAAAERAVADALRAIDAMREGFRTHAGAISIVQTIASVPAALFGSFDRAVPGTSRRLADAFNAGLVERICGSQDVVVDVAALAESVGLEAWQSALQWNVAKFAFDARFVPAYAEWVCRVIAALRGKSRKCLVLDLDNTLWGGVIGDDGLEGIVLGQGDATGEAFLDVQRAALALRERGVVLAVSSKNDDAVARSAFREHSEMLLREEHIAVFQANWNDKPTNLAAIAAELNIGLDALVLLDDNPAERSLVRGTLPEVAVPELPDDPAQFASVLLAAGYFESVAFSEEDRDRARFYAENARRAALRESVTDIEAFLRSLAMEIDFRPFDAQGRARIAQLINKSNQFNLTTRRYTESDVLALERDPEIFTLQVRLKDTFGDNGMIGVVVARPSDPGEWEIDTWLMSCRVLGRRVEAMVLRELVLHARERGIGRLVGRYVPTGKNRLVEDHYPKLGFALLERDPSGATSWLLDSAVEIEPAPMDVVRSGWAPSGAPST